MIILIEYTVISHNHTAVNDMCLFNMIMIKCFYHSSQDEKGRRGCMIILT